MTRLRDTRGPAAWDAAVTPAPPRVSQSLLETHDSVAAKSYEAPPSSPGPEPALGAQPVPPDAVRMVGIRKAAGENLVSPAGALGGHFGLLGGFGVLEGLGASRGDGNAGSFTGRRGRCGVSGHSGVP